MLIYTFYSTVVNERRLNKYTGYEYNEQVNDHKDPTLFWFSVCICSGDKVAFD